MEGYARLQWWEVYNFMSIAHGKCEFDESGIINLKGYNDSGKSAMLRALDVLFYNIRPNSQINFIKDDTDYFRIVAHFEDGVTIFRDKYINGQSLYEMYKDDELIYTTKVNGVLSKVSEVPEPIKVYLGLLMHDGMMLNSRSCFEKQFLVQTSGSENYKMLNSVLKSEELATAAELINNDKNKLASDISSLDAQLTSYKTLYEDGRYITGGMVDYLEEHNKDIDHLTEKQSSLSQMKYYDENLKEIVVYDEVQSISPEHLSFLLKIRSLVSEVGSIVIPDKVEEVNTKGIAELQAIKGVLDSLGSINIFPKVPELGIDRLTAIASIKSMCSSVPVVQQEVDIIDASRFSALFSVFVALKELSEYVNVLASIDKELAEVNNELSGLVADKDFHFVKCPDCGRVIEVGGM